MPKILRNPATTVLPPSIYWKPHGEHFEVWRSDWGPDSHNLMDKQTFDFVEKTFLSFGFVVRQYGGND